jgi:hypothetical protein
MMLHAHTLFTCALRNVWPAAAAAAALAHTSKTAAELKILI